MTVSGFGGFSAAWREFEENWSRRLEQDNLPYFHAVDCAHYRGPFKAWNGDEVRRRALTTDLMNILQQAGLRKFGTVLTLDAFRASKDRRRLILDAVAFCSIDAVKRCYEFARMENITSNLRFVFERGDPQDHIRKWFREWRYQEPSFEPGKRPYVDGGGIRHDPFLGLQAADWISYEYYLDSDRLLYSTEPSDRWALRRFEDMQGHIMLRYGNNLRPPMPDPKDIV